MKLADFEVFAPKGVHHPNRAQSLLCLRQNCAFLFLNRRRFTTNSAREEINRADDKSNNRGERQSQHTSEPQYYDECADQRDYRSKDVGETLVVDRLDRLRIVRDAKTGIGGPPRVVEFKREPL